ncbi:MAG TPA: hypothetical protein VL614_02350 [Acetobacteraceae bacterium]|nr:hypothetical protein [Acetobacteraceae bacterium]
MARRDFRIQREVKLTEASALAPFAQQVTDGANGIAHAATIKPSRRCFQLPAM